MTMLIPGRIWVEGNTVYATGIASRELGATLLKLGLTNIAGEIINKTAFDAWLHRTSVPKLGQDSAMEVGFDDHSQLD